MFADVPAAPPARYRLPPDVAFAPLPGGTALLLDFDGECFALSEEAAELVQRALAGGPDPDRADDGFLDELRQRGLLCAPGLRASIRKGRLTTDAPHNKSRSLRSSTSAGLSPARRSGIRTSSGCPENSASGSGGDKGSPVRSK